MIVKRARRPPTQQKRPRAVHPVVDMLLLAASVAVVVEAVVVVRGAP